MVAWRFRAPRVQHDHAVFFRGRCPEDPWTGAVSRAVYLGGGHVVHSDDLALHEQRKIQFAWSFRGCGGNHVQRGLARPELEDVFDVFAHSGARNRFRHRLLDL